MIIRNHPNNVAKWTPARCLELVRLQAQGLSASQIARQLFTPRERAMFSDGGRNAVIGKLHRLGIHQPSKQATLAAPRPRGASKPREIA